MNAYHISPLLLLALTPLASRGVGPPSERLPNIVFFMADELAYYELSHMDNGGPVSFQVC